MNEIQLEGINEWDIITTQSKLMNEVHIRNILGWIYGERIKSWSRHFMRMMLKLTIKELCL